MTRCVLLIAAPSRERDLAARALTALGSGVVVTAVGDPLEYADAIADSAPAAVIVDRGVGWSDPDDLQARLRGRFPDVPLVSLADPGDTRAAVAAVRTGAADLVFRGDDAPASLCGAVARLLNLPAAHPGASLLGDLVESAGMLHVRFDAATGAVLYANEAFRRRVPGGRGERALLPAEWRAPLLSALADGKEGADVELKVDGVTGRAVARRATGGSGSSEVEALVLFGEATPEPRRPEGQAYASTVAHDLREPLRSVQQDLLAIERFQSVLPPEAQTSVARCREAAHRMDRLILALLPGTKVPEPPFEANRVFDEVLANLRVSIDETGASVTRGSFEASPLPGAELLQLLQNLIGNAVKHHGTVTPRVRVQASSQNGEWVLSVSDSGPGLPKDVLERLGRPPVRGETGVTLSGAGLGLSICRRIATARGGRLWAQSAAGQGTTIHIAVPIPR